MRAELSKSGNHGVAPTGSRARGRVTRPLPPATGNRLGLASRPNAVRRTSLTAEALVHEPVGEPSAVPAPPP